MKFIGVLLFFLVMIASAQVPDFEPGIPLLLSDGDTIIAHFNSSPCMADWNNDGFVDLLIGHTPDSRNGKISLYPGNNTSPPVFTDYVYLQADDSDIVVPAGYI